MFILYLLIQIQYKYTYSITQGNRGYYHQCATISPVYFRYKILDIIIVIVIWISINFFAENCKLILKNNLYPRHTE